MSKAAVEKQMEDAKSKCIHACCGTDSEDSDNDCNTKQQTCQVYTRFYVLLYVLFFFFKYMLQPILTFINYMVSLLMN